MWTFACKMQIWMKFQCASPRYDKSFSYWAGIDFSNLPFHFDRFTASYQIDQLNHAWWWNLDANFEKNRICFMSFHWKIHKPLDADKTWIMLFLHASLTVGIEKWISLVISLNMNQSTLIIPVWDVCESGILYAQSVFQIKLGIKL